MLGMSQCIDVAGKKRTVEEQKVRPLQSCFVGGRIFLYDLMYFFWKFFDGKSFAIMAVMMTGGIGLRSSGLAPERFIAVFYTGLGASLLLAGLLFGRNFGRALHAAAELQNKTEHEGE